MDLMNNNSENDIKAYRAKINAIDEELVKLIAKRLDVCTEIGRFKRLNSLPIDDEEREKQVLEAIRSKATAYPDEIVAIYNTFFEKSKLLQRKMGNLYFIGMPDCGKTRYGKWLASRLQRPFMDTDVMVMKSTGKTIDEIFDAYGEAEFRRLEKIELLRTVEQGGLVVATGGGVIKDEENIRLMKFSGKIVFLNRKIERLFHQKVKNRPLLREGPAAIRKLYSERIHTYLKSADFVIDPDAPGAAERIARFYLKSIR